MIYKIKDICSAHDLNDEDRVLMGDKIYTFRDEMLHRAGGYVPIPISMGTWDDDCYMRLEPKE